MGGRPEPAHYRAVADFRSALRRFLVASARAMRAHGLTPGQYDLLVMCEAAGREGATISSLADRLALAANSVTELVNRAEAAGLVGRRRDVSDGRVARVSPTPSGHEKLAAVVAAIAPEREHLLTLLADVRERLQAETPLAPD